jgi:putative phosphoribosyl transferase
MSETIREMRQVIVSSSPVHLTGESSTPEGARGIVAIAYERVGGTEDFLRCLNDLANAYNRAGLATLSVNLLSPEDEELDKATGFFRENIEVLHQRVQGITNWLIDNEETLSMSIGYFGVGVCAAAILAAASLRPDAVRAIAAISPRIDLVSSYLPRVITPTLIIAGDRDRPALDMGLMALAELTTDTRLDIVREARERGLPHKLEAIPGVASVFENKQSLQRLEQLAIPWFTRYFSAELL